MVVREISQDTFEVDVLESDVPVLVDMWAPWCGPCHIVSPIVEDVAEQMGDKAQVVKLNIDENPRIAQQYGIRSIPTLLFFKDGSLVDRMVGVQHQETLASQLEYLAGTRGDRPEHLPYRATRHISPVKTAAAVVTVLVMLGLMIARALG